MEKMLAGVVPAVFLQLSAILRRVTRTINRPAECPFPCLPPPAQVANCPSTLPPPQSTPATAHAILVYYRTYYRPPLGNIYPPRLPVPPLPNPILRSPGLRQKLLRNPPFLLSAAVRRSSTRQRAEPQTLRLRPSACGPPPSACGSAPPPPPPTSVSAQPARGSGLHLSLEPPHPLPLPPSSPSSSHSPSSSSSRSPKTQWKKGKLLGRGTFGHVYLGFNSESGQMCAIKEVKDIFDDANSKESLKQLNQEIALLSQLSHPNIVQYYGSELVKDTLSVYLEYVSGGSIHKILQEYGAFGETLIRNYTAQVLSGLAYLHGRNTVHRDIKGANILVDPNGEIKLADFGMAKHLGKSFVNHKLSVTWCITNSIGINKLRQIPKGHTLNLGILNFFSQKAHPPCHLGGCAITCMVLI
ncbi:uncharacterized protein LOC141824295 [Curcuma longa]|uniref:uncharacterized protein LOC141824295 n=1 Tax=Curcuma longa TaxID=136217 RepID=UPI003D9EBF4C